MQTNTDRIFTEGVTWLAQDSTKNDDIGIAVRLLAHLTDTTDEWVWQAVIAMNSKKHDAFVYDENKMFPFATSRHTVTG